MLKLKVKNGAVKSVLHNNQIDYKEYYNKDITFRELVKMVLKKEIDTCTSIIVDFSYYHIIELDPKELYTTFLSDLKESYKNFSEKFSIELYYRSSNMQLKDDNLKRVLYVKKNSLILSIFDFYRLLDSYTNNHINNSCLLTLCNKEREFTVYHYSSDITYKKFLQTITQDDKYYFPLTGKNPDLNNIIGNFTKTTLFHNTLSLEKNGSFLFPFPKYNREIEIKNTPPMEVSEDLCINCGKCQSYCPENIDPLFFYHYLKSDEIEEVEKLNIQKCTLCGVCDFICPSNLKITEAIKNFLEQEEE